MVRMTEKALARFWEKVNKRGPDECWEWTGSTHDFGYGQLGIRLSTGEWVPRFAHRIAWQIYHGAEVPEGLFVCHICHNPPCVNPAHLYAGTPADNVRDMINAGRQVHVSLSREENPRAILCTKAVREIRKKAEQGESITSLSQQYGVGQTTISHVLRNETWYDKDYAPLPRYHLLTGERNPSVKLTAEQVQEIRRRYARGKKSYAKIAKEFGVSSAQVGRIIRFETWNK